MTVSYDVRVIQKQTLHLEVAADDAEWFKRTAEELNLSPAAFLHYLRLRRESGENAERLDDHVREIFGRYGDVMRKLAE